MKPRTKKLAPFVPLMKDTVKTPAWKALSHGARSLYMALKGRYNRNTQNAVWLSTREAAKELGSHSDRRYVLRWFRELQHFGFIVMVSPAHHGVNGHGKAPHWRLTEEWYAGKEPTRDFQRWDGEPFEEKKRTNQYQPKNSRGDNVPSTLVATCRPVHTEPKLEIVQSGGNVPSISEHGGGDDVPSITSLTTAYALPGPDYLDIPVFLDRRTEVAA